MSDEHRTETRMKLPAVVSEADWHRAHEELLAKEKAYTRKGDELAAERRRQPMHEITKDYRFEGPDGEMTLLDLFEGRRQLALYVFIRDDDGRVYRTYATNWRGVEAIGSVWSILDRAPLGRQEDWEDTPDGRPQGPRFEW